MTHTEQQNKELIVIRARSLARKASSDSNSALLLLGLYIYLAIEVEPDLDLLRDIRMEVKMFSEELYHDLCYIHDKVLNND